MSDTDTTRRTARRFVEEWTRPGLGAAREMIADGAMAYLAHSQETPGGENPGTTFPLLRWLELLQDAVGQLSDGLDMRVHRTVAEGQWMAVEAESHSRVRDGRLYNMRYTFWLRVEDGMVHELRQYFDTAYGAAYFLGLSGQA